MFCSNCGNEMANNAVVCIKCGVPPRAEKKFCYNCGVAINENQVVCIKCGIDLSTAKRNASGGTSNAAVANSQSKSRMTAVLLAWFLGTFGAHKFYYGSKGWGFTFVGAFVLGALLIVVGIGILILIALGICALVDTIRLLAMGDIKFNERYNETPAAPFKW